MVGFGQKGNVTLKIFAAFSTRSEKKNGAINRTEQGQFNLINSQTLH